MRNHWNSSKYLYGRKLCSSNDIVHNVLKDEKEKSKYYSYFGSGKKYLNKEALNNQNDIKQDKD